MILAHKIALDVTVKQRRYFERAAGCDRFVWNLALEEWIRRHASGERCNGAEIKKDFNAFKYEAFPWLADIHRDAHADAFERVQTAWTTFFKALKKGDKRVRPPRFHKKGRKASFYVANDKLHVSEDGWSVVLPLVGSIRMREKLRFDGKIAGAVVSRTADRWFVSIQVDTEDVKAMRSRTANGVAGVDVGIKHAAIIHREAVGEAPTTEFIEAPKPLKKALRKLRRMQRSVSRRQKAGKNRLKLVRRVARVHARIASIRNDFWNKLTTRLCRENQAVAIEDLNVKGMAGNRKLARALSDVGFGRMRPLLDYKTKLYSTRFVIADRWYPSSKTCSRCGAVKKVLGLGDRVFHCDECGHVQDRDENASTNLCGLAKRNVPTACGEITPVESGVSRWMKVRRVPLVEAGSTPCADSRSRT